MAQPPPRPSAPSRQAPPASTSSPSGTREKGGDKAPGTFFLGRYRVVDEIGIGGMASVHLARMDGPGGFQKWVAIKRIHPHLVEDDQFVDMFLDEARIAAGINHANVAQVFDLGKDDNTYWIAMEYLHGEPLREIIRRQEERRARVSPELAARMCSDAAEGLHAAHELRGKNGQLLGLVHRDVTPHNLFVTYDGYTKVVDFGIAKVADRLSSTRAGTLKGKLAYMSPEQVRGADVDRRTDIFALGVVLWELTTNQRLFRMETDLDTLEKVQACIVAPPSTIVPGYPMELESVVMRALAKRKEDRFQTAREFSRALQNYLMRQGAYIGPEEVASFVRQTFLDRIQKREAHLAWAAEVTSTVNVDQLRASATPNVEEISLQSYDVHEDGRSQALAAPSRTLPAPHAPPMAKATLMGIMAPPTAMTADSLMDDDDDVATTVATREQVEAASVNQGYDSRGGPRPAAGASPYGAPSPYGQQPASPEHTTALPDYTSGLKDLGSTIALSVPDAGVQQQIAEAERRQAQQRGLGAPTPYGQQPSFGAPPFGQAPSFGSGPPGPSSGPPPQRPYVPTQQGFGQAPYGPPQQQQQPASTMAFPAISAQTPPPHGGAGMGPHGLPPFQAMGGPHAPQSQIETALSLPRPDPAALWLAQQEAAAKRPHKRNVGVLVAVVVLTALCVFGIAALLYFKLKAPAAPTGGEAQPVTVPAPTATAVATAAPTAAPTVEPTATPAASVSASAAPSAIAVASAAPTAAPVAPVKTSAPVAAYTGAPPAATAAPAAASNDPGFLTIVCNPFCDDVVDQGRSLGPSPIVRLSVKPGQHRITLKRSGFPTKTISVIVVSGQVTAQRVSMK